MDAEGPQRGMEPFQLGTGKGGFLEEVTFEGWVGWNMSMGKMNGAGGGHSMGKGPEAQAMSLALLTLPGGRNQPDQPSQ